MPVDVGQLNALAVRPKSVLDYQNEYAVADRNALALQGAKIENQNALQAQMDDKAYRAASQQFGEDTATNANLLWKAGLGKQAQGYQKFVTDNAETKAKTAREMAAAEKDRMSMAIDHVNLVSQVAGAAKDQASYQQGIGILKSRGIDVSQLPQQYDPAYVENARQMALTQKQRLEQAWKQKEYDLDVTKAASAQANDVMTPDGKGGFTINKPLLDAKKQVARAGASNVSVNTGQKGYENESKLRNDFKSEPIYKDFQDMKSAHAQIKTALTQGTPIADTAAATKIMKLLDPGSVVRESELGMAMAAAGKMDRMQNYVQMQVSGQKLTPTQRKDFGSLADELMNAASQSYNAKRGEYEQFGKTYGLNPAVLGPGAVSPKGKTAQPAAIPDDIAELLKKHGGK